MRRTHHATVIGLVVLVFSLIGESVAGDNGGSSYSRYGLGDIRYFSTVRSEGMGGAGIAFLTNQSIERANPAGWSQINRTRFSVTALYEGFSSTEGGSSSYLSKVHFQGLDLAVPISRQQGIVFGAGVAPFSKVNYDIISPEAQGGVNYTLQYLGDGGLSQAHLGLSAVLGDDLHLGAKLNYYFGSTNNTIKQLFASTDYSTSEVTRARRYSGLGMTIGAIYSGLGRAVSLGEGSALNLAATFSSGSSLTTSEDRYGTYNSGNLITYDTTTSAEGELRLPYSLAVGMAYQSERTVIAADFSYQKWSDLTLNGTGFPELRDSYRFGTGIELLPKREGSASFSQRLGYRFGVFYNASYYRIRGENINEIGITGGMGFPVFSDTRLGLAAQYSFRGTTDFQLQKDKILRISLTLDIGELWFVQPPEE